jgi:NADPH2:quinone reductase
MKAVQCVEWGLPERLVVAEVPMPEPKAGEVRLRIEAAGVNFPDALIVQKKYQVQPPLPFIPGTEVAGTIDAVGPDVARWKPGDRAVAFVGLGGFAEYVCAPVAMTAPVPAGIASDVAAAFTLTYATSHHALFACGRLKPGETLAVLGAGGGVGLAAVELGKVAGAKVIALASSEDKLAAARDRGADTAIDYTQGDLREALKSATGGRGVDVVYDPVGGRYTEAAIRSLAWRGRLLVVGFADGTVPQIPANLLLIKEASAVGVFWGEFARRDPQANHAMLKELHGWLGEGRLKPHVSKTYRLSAAPRALEALLERRAVGKLVVTPWA